MDVRRLLLVLLLIYSICGSSDKEDVPENNDDLDLSELESNENENGISFIYYNLYFISYIILVILIFYKHLQVKNHHLTNFMLDKLLSELEKTKEANVVQYP